MAKAKDEYPFSIPYAVDYVSIAPPQNLHKPEKNKELREFVSISAQGNAISVNEKLPLPVLMVILDAAHRISPEMVIETESGEKFLIFDHQPHRILRDDDITESLMKESLHTQESEDTTHKKTLDIDIEEIWEKAKRRTQESKLYLEKKSLNIIKALIKPSEVVILIGMRPAILFLLTQHLLHGMAGEIWYQEDKSANPIKIR